MGASISNFISARNRNFKRSFATGFKIVLGTVWGSVLETARGPTSACGCSQKRYWATSGSVLGVGVGVGFFELAQGSEKQRPQKEPKSTPGGILRVAVYGLHFFGEELSKEMTAPPSRIFWVPRRGVKYRGKPASPVRLASQPRQSASPKTTPGGLLKLLSYK